MRAKPAILSGLLVLSASCGGGDGEGEKPDAGDSGVTPICQVGMPDSCPAGHVCVSGVCEPGNPDAGDNGEPGVISVNPEELNFGAFSLGVPVERTLTIENRGQGPLEILELEIENNVADEFVLALPERPPIIIESGAAFPIRVAYTAADAMEDLDRLLIASDDSENALVAVPLIAEYKGIVNAIVVDEPTSMTALEEIDFGNTAVGSVGARTVYVKNVGTGNAVLSIDMVGVEPIGSTIYSARTSSDAATLLNRYRTAAVCNGGVCELPDTTCDGMVCLDVNGSPLDTLAVTVSFMPDVVAEITGQLVIDSSDQNSPTRVDLVGNGIAAALGPSEDPLDMGIVYIGYPEQKTLTVTSLGDYPLDITGVGMVGATPGLTIPMNPPLPAMLDSMDTIDIEVEADPVTPGNMMGTVEVTSNALGAETTQIGVIAEAREPPVISVSVPEVDFGEVHIFRMPGQYEAQTITISNLGGSRLDITAIGMTSTSSPELSVVPNTAISLGPGDSEELEVRYAAYTLGPALGTLRFASNDPARNIYDLPILGEGTDPTITLFKSTPPPTPASPIDFMQVYRFSQSPDVTLSVQNTGVGNLAIFEVGLTQGTSTDFQYMIGTPPSPMTPVLVPPNGIVEIQLAYAPTAVGSDGGGLRIRTNDRDMFVSVVELLGEGVGCPENQWDIDRDPNNGCEYFCVQRDPPVELCNTLDDDCDAEFDEDFGLGQTCDGTGECGTGVVECHASDATQATCSTNPGQTQDQSQFEICNQLDDDCDGSADEVFDLQSEVQHCGMCNNVCSVANGSPLCVSGNCRIDVCNPPFDDCNLTYIDGCETNTMTSIQHCGSCGDLCTIANGTGQCVTGNCRIGMCNQNFMDCNNTPIDGCESDLLNSPLTCGNCNTVCTVANGSPGCTAGNCNIDSCVAPWEDCNVNYADGCEMNTGTSEANCGACGNTCSVANGVPICNSGNCAVDSCVEPFGDCNEVYADGCETNTDFDIDHCGACNSVCTRANATAQCSGGSCSIDMCVGSYDNCNGIDSDGCEADLDSNLSHCGACNTPCIIPGAVEICQPGGVCTFNDCEPGFHDLDGNPANGCEYACTVITANNDEPDDAYIDANCDGVDGVASKAIFVAISGDNNNPGTRAAPLRTISAAIAAADAANKDVYIGAGTYNESATIGLTPGLSLYGGYNPSGSNWLPRGLASRARIIVDDPVGLYATGVNANTTVDHLEIWGSDQTGAGGTAYGALIRHSDGVRLRHVVLLAGNAADGADGTASVGQADSGTDGSPGIPGCERDTVMAGCEQCTRGNAERANPGTSSCGRTGGQGGEARVGDFAGDPGGAGVGGAASGAPIPSQLGNFNPAEIYQGEDGADGALGSAGSPGSESWNSNGWQSVDGTAGGLGGHGGGGGGGAGGGGGIIDCDSYGGGGGGGGGGGCGGTGGAGGGTGGSSFALYLWNSDITIDDVELIAGNGGDGGAGAGGQLGGLGGGGGWGGDPAVPGSGSPYVAIQEDASNGGRGGDGGAGGQGGPGGGGLGGHSICLVRGGGANPSINGVIFNIGTAGTGGASAGNPGADGVAAETLVP